MPDREPGFRQPTAVTVGSGTIERLPVALAHVGGTRPVVLIDANLMDGPVAERVLGRLPAHVAIAAPSGEPTISSVRGVSAMIDPDEVDGVIAVGGGSTLDTAKLARGFVATGAGGLADIPDVIDPVPLPLIAIPTTAGTGAEVGAGAIILDDATGDKLLFRRSQLAADIALADGDLTLGLPAQLTAFTGLDAFAQALMAFLPAGEDSISGQTALTAMKLIRAHLERAVDAGDDRQARGKMMLGSVLSALAMYNAPPVYAGEHIFAEPVGAALGVPHGHAVATLLPGTIEFNLRAFSSQLACLARHFALADSASSDETASEALLMDVRGLVERLRIPPLPERDGAPDLDALTLRCEHHEAYGLNPRPLTHADTTAILRGAFDGTFAVVYRAGREVAHG